MTQEFNGTVELPNYPETKEALIKNNYDPKDFFPDDDSFGSFEYTRIDHLTKDEDGSGEPIILITHSEYFSEEGYELTEELQEIIIKNEK